MKVLFDHHSPFLLAHGGFQIQIEQTLKALRKIGVDVDWLRWWDDSQRPDIIHYFGPVREWYPDFCSSKGIKTVATALLTGLGSQPPWKHRLKGAVIQAAKAAWPPLARRFEWNAFAKADACIALTRHEGGLLRDVFGVPQDKIHIVPNGVEKCFVERVEQEREDWLICVSTIAPRKRVVELAEAAALARRPLRIFGRPYSDSDPYFQLFLKTVERNSAFVSWGRVISGRRELAALYRRAAGFVLVSTMESQSLSALEAAASGCPLLLSDLPWARETFGEHARFVSSQASPPSLAVALKDFHAPEPPRGIPSWDNVADQIEVIYTDLNKNSI